jgi:hypothetical protein
MGAASSPAAAPASRELTGYRGQLEAVQQQSQQLLAGLDNEAGLWRPGPGRWSVAECLEHLNLVGAAVLPAIHQAIDKGIPATTQPDEPYRGWIGAWALRVLEPPPKLRGKAPKKVQPRPNLSLDQVAKRFLHLQEDALACLGRAEGIDLAKTRLRHPLIPLLRFTLGETLALFVTHERLHLWQAEQVVAAPGFPLRLS